MTFVVWFLICATRYGEMICVRLAVFFLAFGGASSYLSRSRSSVKPGHFDLGNSKLGIYDGKSTTIQKHPYLVSIMQYDQFHCAGVILSGSWLITDADCIFGISKSDLTIVAGSPDGVTGSYHTIKKMVFHPNYNYFSSSYEYDYALIKVNDDFQWSDKVGKVTLPTQDLQRDASVVVAGYGDTQEKTIINGSTLKQGTMKWIDSDTCAGYYTKQFRWSDSMACVYNKGKTTLCSGDWGDPIVVDGVLYGIFVGGLNTGFCSDEAGPAIVEDIFLVVDWIQQYTNYQ